MRPSGHGSSLHICSWPFAVGVSLQVALQHVDWLDILVWRVAQAGNTALVFVSYLWKFFDELRGHCSPHSPANGICECCVASYGPKALL